jgi:hypothetical protein
MSDPKVRALNAGGLLGSRYIRDFRADLLEAESGEGQPSCLSPKRPAAVVSPTAFAVDLLCRVDDAADQEDPSALEHE